MSPRRRNSRDELKMTDTLHRHLRDTLPLFCFVLSWIENVYNMEGGHLRAQGSNVVFNEVEITVYPCLIGPVFCSVFSSCNSLSRHHRTLTKKSPTTTTIKRPRRSPGAPLRCRDRHPVASDAPCAPGGSGRTVRGSASAGPSWPRRLPG